MSDGFEKIYNAYLQTERNTFDAFERFFKIGEYVQFRIGTMSEPRWEKILRLRSFHCELEVLNLKTAKRRWISYYSFCEISRDGSSPKPIRVELSKTQQPEPENSESS